MPNLQPDQHLAPLPRSGGQVVDCSLLRCTREHSVHYLPYPEGLPLPLCFIDGTQTVIDIEKSWCVPEVWDDAMTKFEEAERARAIS